MLFGVNPFWFLSFINITVTICTLTAILHIHSGPLQFLHKITGIRLKYSYRVTIWITMPISQRLWSRLEYFKNYGMDCKFVQICLLPSWWILLTLGISDIRWYIRILYHNNLSQWIAMKCVIHVPHMMNCVNFGNYFAFQLVFSFTKSKI